MVVDEVKNELDDSIDVHKIIQSLKREIKMECVEELMPQIMQVRDMYNASNVKFQSEISLSIEELKREIVSRPHLIFMQVLMVLIFVFNFASVLFLFNKFL
jgi:hypothetical protein